MKKYVFIIGMICLFWRCGSPSYRQMEGTIYGTYYHVKYQSSTDWNARIYEQMDRVNHSLSMFDSLSVVSQLNRGSSDRVDSLFVRLFAMARQVYQETDGAFDITVAPLSNAWGFGYKHGNMPTALQVDSLLQWVGFDKLQLTGDRLERKAGMEIDASSIAKGLGVDLVAEFLDRQGVRNYMIDIGGEERVKGQSDKNRPWRIGIDKPIDDAAAAGRELLMVIALTEGALATSGNYRNFYIHEGKKYAHTIDPRTGYPVQQDILSSTVYAPTCMEADAYATSFMVLGLEKSRKVLENRPELQACFVYLDRGERKIWMTEGFRTFIVKE